MNDELQQRARETLRAFKRAGSRVSALIVRNEIDNVGSISSTFDAGRYVVLPAVRAVPLSVFDLEPPCGRELLRIQSLAQQIQESRSITPLIVVVDEQGPYILEGAHRVDALFMLRRKYLPALVVVA